MSYWRGAAWIPTLSPRSVAIAGHLRRSTSSQRRVSDERAAPRGDGARRPQTMGRAEPDDVEQAGTPVRTQWLEVARPGRLAMVRPRDSGRWRIHPPVRAGR